MIHVRHGKGAKDRYLPLPERTKKPASEGWLPFTLVSAPLRSPIFSPRSLLPYPRAHLT
jgi:hypothetical protein